MLDLPHQFSFFLSTTPEEKLKYGYPKLRKSMVTFSINNYLLSYFFPLTEF